MQLFPTAKIMGTIKSPKGVLDVNTKSKESPRGSLQSGLW